MKREVTKAFIDKETGNGYNLGSTFESEDSERVSFLAAEGFLKVEKEEGPSYPDLLKVAKELNIDGYNKMKREALIEAIEKEKAKGDAKKASE